MNSRSLVLLLVSTLAAMAADPVPTFQGSIERLDPVLDGLIAPGAKIEVLATGFNWSEGPVWRDDGIVFSDVPENTVFGWKEGDTAAKKKDARHLVVAATAFSTTFCRHEDCPTR
jgi:gluconolactonase